MFKGSKVEYTGSRKFEDNNSRAMEITVKATTENEAYNLFESLVNYIEEETGSKLYVAGYPAIEVYDDYVEYFDIVEVEDKNEFDQLKPFYMEWKKIAKTITIPVVEETTEIEVVESAITEAPVCSNESVEVTTTTIEAVESNILETKNSNVTLTENTTSNQPKYVIHTEPVNDPYAIGRILRVDLNSNMTITDIVELQNYVLEQYQEGHTDSNGQRQVTYWKIVGIKNTDSAVTEEGVLCDSFEKLELDQTILYNDHNSHWIKAKIIDKTKDNNCICVETETDIDIYNLTLTDMYRIRITI